MPPDIITMLSGLTTAELTLTKRGVNNRRFAMTKGGIPMDPEVLAALIGTPAEGETEFLKTLKSVGVTDQEKIDAAVAQFRIQKGMKDLVPDSVMAAVAKAAGYEGTAKAVTPNEGEDDKKPDATSGKVDPKAKQKDPLGKSADPVDLSQLDPTAKAKVEAIFKSHADMATKSGELEAVVKSLAGEVQGLKDDKLEIHYVAKAAKDFSHLPLGDQALGLMLKSAHDLNPDFAKGFETLLGRMDEMVEKSAMLTNMGAVQKASEGDAWGKLQALANGIVQKSAEGGKEMSNSQALDLVLKSDTGKQLYREYLGDNPRQRGDVY